VGEFLSEQGKAVTIVEILDDVARDMPHISRLPLEMALERNRVRIMTKTKILSVSETGVVVRRKEDKKILPADLVVVAAGAAPHADRLDRVLREEVPEVYEIGDKVAAGTILEAVRQGYDIARMI
jgi:NADH dehydrogenase FAD-containing subunit